MRTKTRQLTVMAGGVTAARAPEWRTPARSIWKECARAERVSSSRCVRVRARACVTCFDVRFLPVGGRVRVHTSLNSQTLYWSHHLYDHPALQNKLSKHTGWYCAHVSPHGWCVAGLINITIILKNEWWLLVSCVPGSHGSMRARTIPDTGPWTK